MILVSQALTYLLSYLRGLNSEYFQKIMLPQRHDDFFIPFGESVDKLSLPVKFTPIIDHEPHPLCILAAQELQHHLTNQKDWHHNFGLSIEKEAGTVIGKMFGVLVVRTHQNEIGYLAAFSGKLAGGNHHAKFVPPVFDSLTHQSFVTVGMTELTHMNDEIKSLEVLKPLAYEKQIKALKIKRRNHSTVLQTKIFGHYHFLNKAGVSKSLVDIFKTATTKKPPSGAGECAGPKLLQYAFQHSMKPLALAEFWWGQSPKSDFWKHGHFYPCCREKCEPILAHMLNGMD